MGAMGISGQAAQLATSAGPGMPGGGGPIMEASMQQPQMQMPPPQQPSNIQYVPSAQVMGGATP